MTSTQTYSSGIVSRFLPDELLDVAQKSMCEAGAYAGLVLIDSVALVTNFDLLQALNPNVPIYPVLKSDAYGHGAEIVASTLAGKASGFCVSENKEAEVVKRVAPAAKIVRMRAATLGEIAEALQKKFEIQEVAGSMEKAIAISKLAEKLNTIAQLQIKLDCSFLGRGGFSCDDSTSFEETIVELFNLPHVEIASITTHHPDPESIDPSNLDDPTIKADCAFSKLIIRFHAHAVELGRRPPQTSSFSSANLITSTHPSIKLNVPKNSFARVGGALYGFDFRSDLVPLQTKQVLHALTWVTDVIHRAFDARVGYYAKYRVIAKEGEKIATIGLGWDTLGREFQGLGINPNPPYLSTFSGARHILLGRQSMNVATLAAEHPMHESLKIDNPLFLTTDAGFTGVSGPTIMDLSETLACQPEFISSRLGNSKAILRRSI